MGWNAGWPIIEEQIVGLYDLGVLTAEIADVLCKAVGDIDIDEGGSQGLESKDHKTMEEILMGLFMPGVKIDYSRDESTYYDNIDAFYEQFHDLARERWGWR